MFCLFVNGMVESIGFSLIKVKKSLNYHIVLSEACVGESTQVSTCLYSSFMLYYWPTAAIYGDFILAIYKKIAIYRRMSPEMS